MRSEREFISLKDAAARIYARSEPWFREYVSQHPELMDARAFTVALLFSAADEGVVQLFGRKAEGLMLEPIGNREQRKYFSRTLRPSEAVDPSFRRADLKRLLAFYKPIPPGFRPMAASKKTARRDWWRKALEVVSGLHRSTARL